jgi:hypothetical protein
MTLLEIERLARKITDALQEPEDAGASAKLAEEFVAASNATNLRLQQCEAMLKAGDRLQAIQLAETAPNLLDCVTALEFRNADRWRSLCQKKGLPVADRIDARAVCALNECYAKGIATDHPLYAAYRKATLARDDEAALKALQSITRLNRGDTNAASELNRLDAKVLEAKLRHLEDLVNGGSPEPIQAHVEAIEGFGFQNRPTGETWQRAQTVRCGVITADAEKLQREAKWREALANLDVIKRLQNEHKLEFPSVLVARIGHIDGWAQLEKQKSQQNKEFQSKLAELRYLILQSEEKDTSARQIKLTEMKDDYEGMHKVWRAIEGFTRPVPEDVATAFKKRASLLETEIARRTAIRRKLTIGSVAVSLLLGGGVAWLALAQWKARELAQDLNEAISQRQARAAEKLLENVHANKLFGMSSRLSGSAAAAETFVNKERNLLKTFTEALGKLPANLSETPTATELGKTSEQLALTRSALNNLAPDIKTEQEPQLRGFEQRWQNYLGESSATVNASVEQWVADAEKHAGELDYRSTPERARTQLETLAQDVSRIAGCADFTNHLKLQAQLLQRGAAVITKFKVYDSELKKLENGLIGLQSARSMSGYSNALAMMAASEFSTSPLAKAAGAMEAVGPSDQGALRSLLWATNAGAWNLLTRSSAAEFIPKTAFPAEQEIFRQLREDPAVSSTLQRVKLWLEPDGAKTLEWITVGGFQTTEGWNVIKAYEPLNASGSCTFSDHDYGVFAGKYKLTPTQGIQRFEMLGILGESAAYRALGLEKVEGATGYGGSLLSVLDALKDSETGSPLFRAYLFLRLVDVMALQPEAWGLTFAPGVEVQKKAINDITGGSLASGDWLIAAKNERWSGKLQQTFAATKGASFAKQATGLCTLSREVAKMGFRYVGFVGLDGKPVVCEGLSAEEIWAYSAQTKVPVVAKVTQSAPDRMSESAMPLSPLWSLPVKRSQLLNQAGVDPESPLFTGVLPPLFAKDGHLSKP